MTHSFAHRIEVRFRDCDAMGHVNNAVYLTYLEQTRLWHWRERLGTDPRHPGEGVILARVECDFRSPATYGETIEVRLRVSGIGRTSFTYEYELVAVASGRVVASARTVQVWYDYEKRRPVPIPGEMKLMLGAAGDT